MTTESIRIKGIPEVTRALYKFNAELAARVTRTALRNGANHMKNQIRAVTPVKTGLAKRSLKVYNSKIHGLRKDGIISIWVGWPRGTGGRILTGRGGKAKPYYIGWVEYGYNRGSKRAGVKASETLGLISKGTGAVRKAVGLRNLRAAKSGRSRVRQGRLYTRYGGIRVEGQHFMERAFDSAYNRSVDIIVTSSNTIITHLAKELGFKIRP